MSDDGVLTQAMRALREKADGTHANASWTRTRILARAQAEGRRRRVRFAVAPIAATFIASIAWGAVTGRLLPWLDFGTHPSPAPHVSKQNPPPQRPEAPTPSAALSTSAATTETTASSARPATSVTDLRNATASSESSSAKQAKLPVSIREQALYVAAHGAHFVDRDPDAALRGWDAYLADYPDGRFALEARYNRSMCLVRLERRDEARTALGPFARGDYGGYRQREARELLDALAATDGSMLSP
jgi:hypothetical protein